MRRTLLWVVLAGAGALATGGCRSPSSHLYALTPVAASSPAAPCACSVVVGPVTIPAMVDMPQMVVTTGPNQVTQDEFNRWAAPLAGNISRVVIADLAVELGTPRVIGLQEARQGHSEFQVTIAVQAFESVPGEAATLDAVWTVRREKDEHIDTGRSALREPATDKGYEALAAAHSRALARLSADIAARIRALAATGGS